VSIGNRGSAAERRNTYLEIDSGWREDQESDVSLREGTEN